MSKLQKTQNEELENVAGGSCGKKTVWYLSCSKCHNQLSNEYNTYEEAHNVLVHAHSPKHNFIIESKEVDK